MTAPAPVRLPVSAMYARIVKQPKDKVRFRYEVEQRSGLIHGVDSTEDKPTYPTIEICGCTDKHRKEMKVERAIVMVSCVTEHEPFRQHPHKLVAHVQRNNAADRATANGVYVKTVNLHMGDILVTLDNIGIQSVKKSDFKRVLQLREKHRVDPFKQGFKNLDFNQNAVRLGIHVFLADHSGKCVRALEAIASGVIYNDSKLEIKYIIPSFGPIMGGNEVVLLCNAIKGDLANVDVVVYEEGQTHIIVPINRIHLRAAIAVVMPPYSDTSASKHVKVFIQMKQSSGNQETRSNSVHYEYKPVYEVDYYDTKRRKIPVPRSVMEQIERGAPLWKQQQTIKPNESYEVILVESPEENRSEPWQQDRAGVVVTRPSDVACYGQQQFCTTPGHGIQPWQLDTAGAAGAGSGNMAPSEYAQEQAYASPGQDMQPWKQDVAEPSNRACYEQMQVHATCDATPAQDLQQVPHISPSVQPQTLHFQSNMQTTNTHSQVIIYNPQRQMRPHDRVVSAHRPMLSPQGHVLSPQGQIMSPQTQIMSPQRQIMSPQGPPMSPQGQPMSPQGPTMSTSGYTMLPQKHIMSRQGQMISPRVHMMQPQGQIMSPQRQMMQPQGQMIQPQGQIMSPQGQMMQPQGQIMSPQSSVSLNVGQGEFPGEGFGVAQIQQRDGPLQPVQLNIEELSESSEYMLSSNDDMTLL